MQKLQMVCSHVHVCRSSNTGGIKGATEFTVPGSKGRGRPLKAWNDCVKNDILKRGLLDADL